MTSNVGHTAVFAVAPPCSLKRDIDERVMTIGNESIGRQEILMISAEQTLSDIMSSTLVVVYHGYIVLGLISVSSPLIHFLLPEGVRK